MIFSLEKKEPVQVAFQTATEKITYKELVEQVRSFGEMKIPRSLIFVLCKNDPGAVFGYIAALEHGLVPLLLDADMESQRLQQFMERYQPSYVWCEEDGNADLLYRYAGYGLYATGCLPDKLHENLALLLPTSGSTGDGKLVKISRENLVSNASSIAEYLKIDEKERPITTLPMHYTYGLSIINSHLLVGGTILMTRSSVVQQEFWELFEEGRATSFGGVPYTYQLLKRIHFFERAYPSLTAMTQAGGHLPEQLQQEIAEWAKEHGIRFFIMYGQTEATARMSYLPWERCMEKTGSIGIPIPGGVFQLRDETGNEIKETEQIGELIYQGRNVTMGYAKNKEDLINGDERNGILETGDLARRDADGFYYIVGRKSRFLKIYGNRISLDSCEKMLTEQFAENGKMDFACTGEDDKLCVCMLGEIIDFHTDTVRHWMSDTLHLSPKAITVCILDEFPRTSSGKVDYAELKHIAFCEAQD